MNGLPSTLVRQRSGETEEVLHRRMAEERGALHGLLALVREDGISAAEAARLLQTVLLDLPRAAGQPPGELYGAISRLLEPVHPGHLLLICPGLHRPGDELLAFQRGEPAAPPPQPELGLLERAQQAALAGESLLVVRTGAKDQASACWMAAPLGPPGPAGGGRALLLVPAADGPLPGQLDLLRLELLGQAPGQAVAQAAAWRRARTREVARNLSLLSRGIVHDLNNIRAGLFSNLDYIAETLAIWDRTYPLLERLVQAAAQVPALRSEAEAIASLAEEEGLAVLVADTPELLQDLADTRLRCQRLVERLEQIAIRNKGLLVEEELEEILRRVLAELTEGRTGLPLPLPRFELRCPAPVRLFTYRQQLELCLVELLRNAEDAAGAGGLVSITAVREGEEAVIRIEDDGPGMSGEERRLAFQPFFTTRCATAPANARRGLGLNIALRAALQLGGDIQLAPRAGRGSVATLRLPAPSRRGRTLLLLGDVSEDVAQALSGARLRRVEEVSELGRVLADGPPALVLLDSDLPPVRALGLLEELDRLTPGVPVLRCGGLAQPPDAQQREAEQALEQRVTSEAEDLDLLDHEVRRLLALRVIQEEGA